MKSILQKLSKIFLLLFIVSLVASTATLLYLYITRNNELDSINSLYKEAQQNLNQNLEENQMTIEDLQKSFADLNKQVDDFKKENSELKSQIEKLSKTGKGRLTGNVIAYVTGGNDQFSQFQLVCAENIVNKNIKYCASVSAMEQVFTLDVVTGTYHISSAILLEDGTVSKTVAYFTEYVKCVMEKSTLECDPKLSQKLVPVKVDTDTIVEKINPIDFQFKKN